VGKNWDFLEEIAPPSGKNHHYHGWLCGVRSTSLKINLSIIKKFSTQ